LKDVKYRRFENHRRFGVELEVGSEVKKKAVQAVISEFSNFDVIVSRYSLSTNNSYWHIKDDATCGIKGRNGPKGVEIASFVGSTSSDLEHIANIAEKLSLAGCKTNDNCGLHIHAEVNDLTVEQLSVVVACWIKFERVLSYILPIRRYVSDYCKFFFHPDLKKTMKNSLLYRDFNYAPDIFWSTIVPQNLSFYENDDRRFNLNLVNLARAIKMDSKNRRTLELRWPEGTLNSRDIRCWVRIFLNFIQTCKDKKMPENLHSFNLEESLNHLGLNHENNSFIILSSQLFEAKTWFLERIIENHKDAVSFYKNDLTCLALNEAKKILDEMWSPIKNYA
jgi:hypothetical protein